MMRSRILLLMRRGSEGLAFAGPPAVIHGQLNYTDLIISPAASAKAISIAPRAALQRIAISPTTNVTSIQV